MSMHQKSDTEKALEAAHGLGETHFCVRCAMPVKTKVVSGFSYNPFGNNGIAVSPPVCAVCGSGVVAYTPAAMATLFKHQMQLLDQAGRVEELARQLRQTLDQREQYIDEVEGRHWHPSSGRIIKRGETALAGAVGRVRIGWEGKAYELTEQGLAEAVADLRRGAEVPADLKAEVDRLRREAEDLRRENAGLKARLEAASGTGPSARSRRSLEI